MFVYNVNRSGRLMVDRYLIQREPVSEEQGSSRADDERLVSPEQLFREIGPLTLELKGLVYCLR